MEIVATSNNTGIEYGVSHLIVEPAPILEDSVTGKQYKLVVINGELGLEEV